MAAGISSDNRALIDFIDAIKNHGASDDFVVALLRQNGWSEKRIYQAFSNWYVARIGREVPSGGGRIEAAKDAFLYLLAFITLGIWAIQLGALLFLAIDRTFPNPTLDYRMVSSETRSMANELASVMVAFPLFLLVTRWIVRSFEWQPERLESSVRKWLTYLALVITASTMIGDAVTFLAYFLRGDLDARFGLKVLTVLVIAGGVFAFYLDSLHRDQVSSSRNRSFAFAAIAAVAFGLIVGFAKIGSPAGQRIAAADARRLFDLSSLAQGAHLRWQTSDRKDFVLPVTIRKLSRMGVAQQGVSILDPVTGQPYSYTPLKGTSYRLCSTFSSASSSYIPTQWRHAAGNVCFPLDASEDVEMVQREW